MATDSRDTEGSTVRRAADFGEGISKRNLGKASIIAEAITAHGYSQMEVASFLGFHYSTISRLLTADKRANVKTLSPCLGRRLQPHPKRYASGNRSLDKLFMSDPFVKGMTQR
jgi:hypothetical protein